ncbi:hypothetical protein AKJ38_00680 [candidate division MSBL1 archaeon SCGC-AAA259I14]|uniref:DUF1464 domain-containing protein n=2 Tax=candidate division MSBL1 TaxID=215777 RepID=A0A133UTY0_9EURY|nr:hypothetical protein AKJ66_01985 [candidate division MSBL1 archaeon SCGC-AAA259E22]KXA97609.1 hypothetical protein AKJ38_00680 [candidate division MSBL1 archaeon SCGC-AAA259I14]
MNKQDVKALGIDPGTKSFDVCGLENGSVFYEDVLDSAELAENPNLLVESIENVMPLDLIAAPSGYGVELTYLEDLDLETLEDWYLTYILLLKKKDLEVALKEKNPGIMVYSAMTESALEMKRKKLPVCYIPGVINMSTVPEFRKINNLDMGTVDKLCCAVLGVFDQSKKLDIPYSDVSFILVEMGAGYNACIGVENGKIVDGIGGTMNGIGFLTSGEVDLEMVQLARGWDKTDVFTGGVSTMINEESVEFFIEKKDEYEIAWNRMMEDVEKTVSSLKVSVSDPKEVLISGRLTGFKEIRNELMDRLGKFTPVRKINPLSNADRVKEAAQGYAMVSEGIAGGKFSKLIDWMEIKNAKGTALDYVYHPKGKKEEIKLKKNINFRS